MNLLRQDKPFSKRQLEHFCLLQTIYYACIFDSDGRLYYFL